MKRAAAALLALVLAASAGAKAADLHGTAALLSANLQLAGRSGLHMAVALILVEAAAAAALVLRPGRAAYAGFTGLFVVFLLVSGWGAARGWTSCGCFGSRLAVDPWVTVLKNLVLVAAGAALLLGPAPRKGAPPPRPSPEPRPARPR